MIRRLIILLLIVGCVFAREYIAIIDFEGINVSGGDAKALTQRLTSEMIKLEVYQVLERSEMKRLLEEQKFQYSGCVDIKCAVEVGKMLGAKYMVVGSISKVGRTYSIDSRLIDVETSESYVSGSYSMRGEIDGLMNTGMQSIAYQLCEMQTSITSGANKSKRNSSTAIATNNAKRKNNKFGLSAIFGTTIPIGDNLSVYSSGSNFGIRLDTPLSIGKKGKIGIELYLSSLTSVETNIRITNIISTINIISFSSLEFRTGFGIAPHSIGDYSQSSFTLTTDLDYVLPLRFIGFNVGMNMRAQRILSTIISPVQSVTGQNSSSIDILLLRLYIKR